jgi:hypothetical protein
MQEKHGAPNNGLQGTPALSPDPVVKATNQ